MNNFVDRGDATHADMAELSKEMTAACSDLYVDKACREAWARGGTPGSSGESLLRTIREAQQTCREVYCPLLPSPKPDACDSAEGDWTELRYAINAFDLGPERVAVLKNAATGLEAAVQRWSGRVEELRRTRGADPAPSLVVRVTCNGVLVEVSGENMGPGCVGPGPGTAVPFKGKSANGEPIVDTEGLRTCAVRLKSGRPELGAENGARITADNGISYRVVTECMDAIRKEGDRDLFPDVSFGVPR